MFINNKISLKCTPCVIDYLKTNNLTVTKSIEGNARASFFKRRRGSRGCLVFIKWTIWCSLISDVLRISLNWQYSGTQHNASKQASKYVLHADTVFEPHTHSWVAHNPIVPKQIWKMDRSDEYVPLEIYLHLSSVPNGLDSSSLVQTFFRPNEKYHNIWTWSENQFYYHYYCYETICVLVGIWL